MASLVTINRKYVSKPVSDFIAIYFLCLRLFVKHVNEPEDAINTNKKYTNTRKTQTLYYL